MLEPERAKVLRTDLAGPPPATVGELADCGIRAVLLDIDDTLVRTREAFTEGLACAAARFLPDAYPARLPEMLALWRADPNGHYRAYTRGEITMSEQRRLRAEELQTAFGGAPLGDASGQWDELFLTGFEQGWKPHADAIALVAALRGAGLTIGVVSNAERAMQGRKLRATGFADLVQTMVCVSDVGVGKPDARIFVAACAAAGSELSQTVYIGDELDIDARGSLAAGMPWAYWLDRPAPRRGGVHDETLRDSDVAVRRIETLNELIG